MFHKKDSLTFMKTIKILGKFIGFLILLICILLPVSFCLKLWSERLLLAEYVPVSFSESTKELQNPYIGWYTLRGYYLSEEKEPNLSGLPSVSDQPGLTLLEINLHAYQNQPIGEKGLLQLNQILEAWKRSGSQLILRFVYDWDGKGEENEPEELHTILTHMEQTIPIVNDYKDCVYLLQGIFVGSYGEMHGTKFMGREDMLTLISTLDNLADSAIYLSVRTPAQLRTILAAQGSSASSTSSTAAAKSPAETASSVNSSAGTKVQDEAPLLFFHPNRLLQSLPLLPAWGFSMTGFWALKAIPVLTVPCLLPRQIILPPGTEQMSFPSRIGCAPAFPMAEK